MSDKVLVLNCGSSSVKYELYAMPEGKVLAKGVVERVGEEGGAIRHGDSGGERREELVVPDHRAGLDAAVRLLTGGESPAVGDLAEIKAVGHRVVHGGEAFTGSVLITAEVEKVIEEHFDLAPLHNPPNLTGIRAAAELLPGVPQVACFDTAFHTAIPEHAYLYALPYEVYQRYRVRRYGFHGTSHRYVARRCAEIMGLHKYALNAITCHLGNGCSMAAVASGRSVDTSMGMTPLEGLVMGTRSGDVDPGIIYYLAEQPEFEDFAAISRLLNKRSGLLGLSGVSNDMREVLEAAGEGHARARLAVEVFAYRIRKYIGAYAAVLPPLHAVIFTGGIGENAAEVRERICTGLEANLGVRLDPEANRAAVGGVEADVAAVDSAVRLMVIPTDEEKAIAADTYRLTVGERR
jgi:acetate kinase